MAQHYEVVEAGTVTGNSKTEKGQLPADAVLAQ
jgi:hypothetical protein